MRDPVFITGKTVKLRTLLALILGGLVVLAVIALTVWLVFSWFVRSTIG